MRSARIALIPMAALLTTLSSPTIAHADDAQDLAGTVVMHNVVIMGSPASIPVEIPEPEVVVVPATQPIPTDPAFVAVATTPPPPTLAGMWVALKAATPEQLIRFLWPESAANRMIAIAKRESGLRCNADNPRSSAAGLFQTIGIHRARAERLGLRWSDITGPDCVADAFLAFDIWRDSGFAPWRL